MNFFLYILLLLVPFLSFASIPNEDCLSCHDKYTGFHHGKTTCIQCHNDITSLPHDDKLKKPSCKLCHGPSEENYKKSVHSAKKLSCKDCHNVHFLSRDKKTCTDCHLNVSHKTLPAKERHLKIFNCLTCHGIAQSGHINILIETGNRDIIKLSEIDRDNNRLLDPIEWDNLLNVLKRVSEEEIELKKSYEVKTGDPHIVTQKPVSCRVCHRERGLFTQATVTLKGKTVYKINTDPKIFIHEIPSVEDYKHTVHGKKGIKCSDCHISEKPIDDKVCLSCHEKIYSVYKESSHAKEGAAKCTDCHNPHKIKSTRELSVHERVITCTKCHKDYLEKHSWLPHTVLHFKYLECSTCHSPKSKKSMVFNFAVKEPEGVRPLVYSDFVRFFGDRVDMRKIMDTDKDGEISSNELTYFINELQKKFKKGINIDASIIVTEVYHHYSEKNVKSKICSECHSRNAPFYESMVIAIPERDGVSYIPAKGTILSAFPTSVFIDMCLLGESKIRHEDIKSLLRANLGEKKRIISELGYKLIDFAGITIILLILLGIIIHTILRVLVRK